MNCTLVNKCCGLLVEKSVKAEHNNHRITIIFTEALYHTISFMTIVDKLNFRLVCKNFDSLVLTQKNTLDDVKNLFDKYVNEHQENKTEKEKFLAGKVLLSSELDELEAAIRGFAETDYSGHNAIRGFNNFKDSTIKKMDQLTKALEISEKKIEESHQSCIKVDKLLKKIREYQGEKVEDVTINK
jgi:hypothetical protein